MRILNALFLLVALAAGSSVYGQEYYTRFKALSSKTDAAGQYALLKEWRAARPNDPELYVCYFNYYVNKSVDEVISLGIESKGNGFEITDSTGAVVGYLGSETSYKKTYVDSAFLLISEGIRKFPDRLDMRFGKTYLLGETHNYTAFADEVIAALNYGVAHGHKWKWSEGKKVDTPQQFFLSSIQDYTVTLYNSGKAQLPLMRKVSEEVLKHYPEHLESLSNMAITYMLEGNNDKGLIYLLKAETINPKDAIVLNNIAEAYKRKEDKPNAIAYYNKVIAVGDEETAAYARKQLEALK